MTGSVCSYVAFKRLVWPCLSLRMPILHEIQPVALLSLLLVVPNCVMKNLGVFLALSTKPTKDASRSDALSRNWGTVWNHINWKILTNFMQIVCYLESAWGSPSFAYIWHHFLFRLPQHEFWQLITKFLNFW